MQTNGQVRDIKRERRIIGGDDSAIAGSTNAVAASTSGGATTERDVRAVVEGWVREHREGVGDYRHALSTLFARLDAGALHVANPASVSR
jgi:hypothetical protein